LEEALSQRDLPVWARAIAAALLIAGGWFSARSNLEHMLGAAIVDLSAGVIAVSVLLGMRLPLDLWPRAPQRARFSVTLALATAFGLGGLILLGGPIAGVYVEEGQFAAIIALTVGGVAFALAAGRTMLTAFSKWFGLAVTCAVLPGIAGILALTLQDGGMPAMDVSRFFRGAAFFLVLGSAMALVTQELAFRRLLIGQSGDAGLVAVILAAFVFGIWHATNPVASAGVLPALGAGAAGGLVAGSLYILSRSLLVPACYYGVRIALARGIELGVGGGEAVSAQIEVVGAAVTAGIALILAVMVVRRSGFFGALQLRSPDVVGD
jgi:membrane protease YdiL (CAAX protease family)